MPLESVCGATVHDKMVPDINYAAQILFLGSFANAANTKSFDLPSPRWAAHTLPLAMIHIVFLTEREKLVAFQKPVFSGSFSFLPIKYSLLYAREIRDKYDGGFVKHLHLDDRSDSDLPVSCHINSPFHRHSHLPVASCTVATNHNTCKRNKYLIFCWSMMLFHTYQIFQLILYLNQN